MTRPVDMACFDARYLALMHRFPNQVQSNGALVLPAPEASGVLIFAVSHNDRYLLCHDATGFSNGVYEFGLPEDFFGAVSPRHIGQQPLSADTSLRLALSNGEYRLYQNADNEQVFDHASDSAVLFTWAGRIAMPGEHLQVSLDKMLHLHQSEAAEPMPHALANGYRAEVEFMERQLSVSGPVEGHHFWIREADGAGRVFTRFTNAAGRVEVVISVEIESAIA